MTTDTERLRAVADEVERRLAERRARPMSEKLTTAGMWIAAVPSSTLLVLTVVSLSGAQVDALREDLNPALLLAAIAGVIFFVGGLVAGATQDGHRKLRDDLKGLDFEALGRLAAQLQEIELALPALRAQGELDRAVMLRRLAENEGQRQADLARFGDAARKLFDALDDRIAETAERVRTMESGIGALARVTVQLAEAMQRLVDRSAVPAARQADAVDAKYLADMSEAVRLGREIERRKKLEEE